MLYLRGTIKMLKRFTNKLVHVLVAVVVLISTSGFTVFEHSCTSSKTHERSLFIPVFSCDHYQDEVNEEKPTCCDNHQAEEPITCGTDDCCETETIIVKLDATYDLQYNKLKVSIATLASPIETNAIVECPFDEESLCFVKNDHPPPLAGKALRIFLHQLNAHPPVV